MVKACNNELIEQFDLAIREYFNSPDSILDKDSAPDFKSIRRFIDKEKYALKNNKKGSPARKLKKLYEYLETLDRDNPATWLSDVYNRKETIALFGNATKAYQALRKEIASYVLPEEQEENTVSFTTALSSCGTWTKNIVSHAAKNTTVFAKNPVKVFTKAAKTVAESVVATANTAVAMTARTATAAASHPWTSVKVATSVAFYTLALQPVAGTMIAGNIIREHNESRTPTIKDLFENKSEWFRYLNRDSIEIFLQEFEHAASEMSEENKCSFFDFLEEAGGKNKLIDLSHESIDIIFNITKNELEKTYNLNKKSDLEKLYKLFFIFYKLGNKLHIHNVKIIFKLLDRYALQIASHRVVLNSENRESIKRNLILLSWVLRVNFDEYIKISGNCLNINEVKRHFEAIQKMNQAFYQFDNNSIVSFSSTLHLIRQLRFYYFSDDQNMNAYLDNAVQTYIAEALNLAENNCFAVTKDYIKEAAYILYVRKLPNEARQSFKDLYKIVRKHEVFTHLSFYQFKFSTHTKKFIIYSQQPLNDDKKSIVEKAINNTCQRMEDLKSRLGIVEKEDVSKITFRVHLFNDNEAYSKYAPLWEADTSGGGYAHVRTPAEIELPFHDSQPFKDDRILYETFIYQREGDTRNKKDKEGGNFRNLGHEIQHTIFYALIGAKELKHLPSWLVEGIANYLGNENCFKEEADYIKRAKKEGRIVSIQQIIAFDYLDGGDLYYFGSTLAHFMREKHPNILKNILIAAQEGKQKSEIEQTVKRWATDPKIEKEFQNWFIALIDDCTEINKSEEPTETPTETPTEAPIDWLTAYHKDLQNNPSLLKWIESHGPIEFTFGNIIFTLEADKLTATLLYKENFSRRQKQITLDDYIWLKQALAIYATKNKLEENNPIDNSDTSLASYFLRYNFHYFKDSTLKKVNVSENNEFKEVIEDFALKACLPLILRKSLSKQEFYNSVLALSTVSPKLSTVLPKPELTEPLLLPTCQAYLKRKDQPVLKNKPVLKKQRTLGKGKKKYRRDLKKNPDLLNLIQKHGSIEFTFNDTTFKLTANCISRHYHVHSQPMTQGDYYWLKSALAIYITKIALKSFNLSKKESYQIEKSFLRKSESEIENKAIQMIYPKVNEDFHQVIEGFVLKTFFKTSKQNFYATLSKKVDEFKASPSYIADELSHGRELQPAYLRKQPDFSASRSALIYSVNEAKNPSLTTSQRSSDGSWQLGWIALPITLISGIILYGSIYCNKVRKSILSSKRNLSQTAQSGPEPVVGMQPEEIPLTHASMKRTSEHVSPDYAMTQLLEGENDNHSEAQQPLLQTNDSRQVNNPSGFFRSNVVEKKETERDLSPAENMASLS